MECLQEEWTLKSGPGKAGGEHTGERKNERPPEIVGPQGVDPTSVPVASATHATQDVAFQMWSSCPIHFGVDGDALQTCSSEAEDQRVGLGVGTEGGPGAGFEQQAEAGPQARTEVGVGKVSGILGRWRHLIFC